MVDLHAERGVNTKSKSDAISARRYVLNGKSTHKQSNVSFSIASCQGRGGGLSALRLRYLYIKVTQVESHKTRVVP